MGVKSIAQVMQSIQLRSSISSIASMLGAVQARQPRSHSDLAMAKPGNVARAVELSEDNWTGHWYYEELYIKAGKHFNLKLKICADWDCHEIIYCLCKTGFAYLAKKKLDFVWFYNHG